MPRITFADFKLDQATCEIRYDSAYLIFDRTGAVISEVRRKVPHIKLVEPTPTATSFRSGKDRRHYALEIDQARVTEEQPESGLDAFAKACQTYFDIAMDLLELKTFTRIGLRLIFKANRPLDEDLEGALQAYDLLRIPQETRFGASDKPKEMTIRWQGDDLGAIVHFLIEKGTIDAVVSKDVFEQSEIHKEFNRLLLDVDFYTVAPVQRDQWGAEEWIPQKGRIIRKEVARLFGE